MIIKHSKKRNSIRDMFLDKSGELGPGEKERIEKILEDEETRLKGLGKSNEAVLFELRKKYEELQHNLNEAADAGKKKVEASKEKSTFQKIKNIKPTFDKHRKNVRQFLSGGGWGDNENRTQVGGWMFVFLAGMLYYLDMWLGFNGINVTRFWDNLAFTSTESMIGWFFNSIVITLLIAYYVIYRPPDIKEFISFFFLAELISLIIFLGGLGTMLIHLAFVFIFYFLYIRGGTGDDSAKNTTANWTTFIMLAIDFFGFGILAEVLNNSIVSNRLIIPIWFYYALVYTRNTSRSFWTDFWIFVVIIGNVFYFVGGIDNLRNMGATLTPEDLKERENFIATSWNNVKQTMYKAIEGFRRDLDAQLEYASGGYYKGRVEKTKKEPLGVYIQEVKTAEPTFYTNEPVIIWGTLKAHGIDDGMILKIFCKRKGSPDLFEKIQDDPNYDGTRVGFLDDGLMADKVIPKDPFLIYQQEHKDFECRFNNGALEERSFDITSPVSSTVGLANDRATPGDSFDIGIHTVQVGAEFGFSTLAYLRAYFMDEERVRSMRREGIDPLKKYDVKEKDSVAVYTTGPVAMGMQTTNPLISVGTNSYTRLGVTLENIEGWDGEIKNVEEIILLTPKGASLSDSLSSCTKEFKKYELTGDSKYHCYNNEDSPQEKGQSSCERFVYQPCLNICQLKDGSNCKESCKKDYESCVKDCKVLFEVENSNDKSEYSAYALDLEKEKQYFENLGRFRSFSCRVEIDKDVLDNSPMTLRYFRAKARYNYKIKKDVEVRIESNPEDAKKTKAAALGKTVSAKGDVKKRIESISKQYYEQNNIKDKGISLDDFTNMILAIAWKESGFVHCNAKIDPCTEAQVTKGSSGEIGLMQILPTTALDVGCTEDNLLDLNKNIECGIKVLNQKYNIFDKGLSEDYLINKGWCSQRSIHLYKYSEYRKWDAALRGYNGWSCTGGDSDYVETVKGFIDTKPWLSIKDTGTSPYTQTKAPENVKLELKECKFKLTWDLPNANYLDEYRIERLRKVNYAYNIDEEVTKDSKMILDKTKTSYTDSNKIYEDSKNNCFRYLVVAINTARDEFKTLSNEICLPDYTLIAPNAEYDNLNNEVKLSFELTDEQFNCLDDDYGIKDYYDVTLQRKDNNDDYEDIKSIQPDNKKIEYTDTDIDKGNEYTYRVLIDSGDLMGNVEEIKSKESTQIKIPS